MCLSAYHYDGDAAPLLAAYDRLRAQFPSDAFLLHVCVATRRRTADAGLPQPRIEPLGAVHDVVVRTSVSS